MVKRSVVLVPLLLLALALAAQQSGVFSLLKSTVLLGRQADGLYLVPTNQLLAPWGEQTVIPGRPVDMAWDGARRFLAVLNTRGIVLLDGSAGVKVADIETRQTSYTGIAFRPGDRQLWASETSRNGPDSILIAELSETGKPGGVSRIGLNGHPLPAGIAFSPDGRLAYVAFSRSNTLAVINADTLELLKEVDAGIAPFGVAVAGERVFVTNRGGRRAGNDDTVAPSSGSSVATDAVTGASITGTLSVLDSRTGAVKEILVGLAPSLMAVHPRGTLLAVANSHSDSISLIDTKTLARTDVRIPAYPETALGSQPVAVAFSQDGSTLYVACGGNDAIAVLRESSGKYQAAGAIPTAWFPTSIAVAQDGSLRVLNLKGTGNTANNRGTFNSRQYQGTLERIPVPTAAQLAAGTREVKAANSPKLAPAGGVANLPSLGIGHVFLIVKENRTYDQLFGDIGKGNSDPKLVMYGRQITPNHHALAEQYVLLDNFYTGGAISFDGHQWLMQGFVSDYVERAFAASPRGYAYNMADALVVAPTGFFWQAAAKPLDLRIYGEFQLPARWDPQTRSAVDLDERDDLTWNTYWQGYREGRWQTMVGSRSGVPALAKYVDPRFPYPSLSITDQIRAEEFLRELAEFEQRGTLPQLIIVSLNSDHTNGTRPGTPTPRSMVADNDLALGRMVEAISKSRFWPNSLILVTEDDAQDGVDHVDGHRTIALAIGPHIRRGAVDSNNYNHTCMIRTIQEIFRIPQKTRALEAARSMTSVFVPASDLTPYQHLVPGVALDEMNPPLRALAGRQLWGARQSMAMNFKDLDDAPPATLNRILWWDAKGWNTPYPK
ncbi:MAG TPA: bifunctional YncE family protein/alkaline phosphatase family protein [Candidatus Acidoferrales bacterium]|nr:bifunctional YncE family protein/alkaline phosphatase family protein [Candidatus Acidoferrales bacterium]